MKFLNTASVTQELESLIRSAQKQLVLVSPYLKFNKRIRALLEYKSKIKIVLIYGKKNPKQDELDWIQSRPNITCYFCPDLHAKCYLNEQTCVIASMNLYEFSQQNNYEMGVHFSKADQREQFDAAVAEIRLILSASTKQEAQESEVFVVAEVVSPATDEKPEYDKLTTSKFARKHKQKTAEMVERLQSLGYLSVPLLIGEPQLTDKAIKAGVVKRRGRTGDYWLWPIGLLDE